MYSPSMTVSEPSHLRIQVVENLLTPSVHIPTHPFLLFYALGICSTLALLSSVIASPLLASIPLPAIWTRYERPLSHISILCMALLVSKSILYGSIIGPINPFLSLFLFLYRMRSTSCRSTRSTCSPALCLHRCSMLSNRTC